MSNFKLKENADIKVSSGLNTQGKNILPIAGQIILFAGAGAPNGWAICDGTAGTPDLRGKFIVGAQSNTNLGASFGATNHTHTYNTNTVTVSGISESHSTVDMGVSAGGGGSHNHYANTTFGSGSGANNLLANSGNAGGPIQFVNKPHSHNGSGSANWNAASVGNHTHNGQALSENARSVAHNTSHSHAAGASGNAAGGGTIVPNIVLNYIMKL